MAAAVGLLVCYLVFILCFALGVCWLWPEFVDTRDPPSIRSWLYAMVLLLTIEELCAYANDVVSGRALIAILLCNVWGHLDAFLRFPVVHDLDSFFGLKQVCLLLLKLVGYIFGFRDIGRYVGWFVLALLVNVLTLPILWLTALPIGDVSSYHQKHDVVDMDVLMRIWRFVTVPSERTVAATRLKASARKGVVALVQVAPFLKPLAVRCDPALTRILRKAPAV
eukprot:TRINITY_DN114665_c0_g1_i1.p1 TRINITY_DN114665_c0_g1~~TRINITY_DN114665_c0_g1_i1.p1  ORF type:complete len:232 (-),score=27.94 TRINITY_DN114665_c0_g1_i1:56-724(-)